jgi:hypothetical protein
MHHCLKFSLLNFKTRILLHSHVCTKLLPMNESQPLHRLSFNPSKLVSILLYNQPPWPQIEFVKNTFSEPPIQMAILADKSFALEWERRMGVTSLCDISFLVLSRATIKKLQPIAGHHVAGEPMLQLQPIMKGFLKISLCVVLSMTVMPSTTTKKHNNRQWLEVPREIEFGILHQTFSVCFPRQTWCLNKQMVSILWRCSPWNCFVYVLRNLEMTTNKELFHSTFWSYVYIGVPI